MTLFVPDPKEKRERRQGLVALFFVGLALLLVYLPAPRQQQVAAALRASVLRPFVLVQETLARARLQTTEVGGLQAERDSLVAVLSNQVTLAQENRRLRNLLGLRRRLGTGYVSARVLRPGTRGSESMFLLDAGRGAGIVTGAPVITGDGLLGVVREVREDGAIGMDWTHPDFRSSAMDVDGRAFGIVEPRRGDFREEDRLALVGTPYHTQLDDGTLIVTSGRGGVYPRGIPIGSVDGVAEAQGGWRKTYWVRPAVAVGSVIHVLVSTGRDTVPADLTPAMVPDSVLQSDSARAEPDTTGPAPDTAPPGSVGADTASSEVP